MGAIDKAIRMINPEWTTLEDYFLKEKTKGEPKIVKEPPKTKAPPAKEAAKAAPKKQKPKPTVEDQMEQFYTEGQNLTPDPRPTPRTSSPMSLEELMKAGGGGGAQKQYSPAELSEMLNLLAQNPVQLPDFDFSQNTLGDITPEQLGGAPIDVRPIAAFMDDIYGTKMLARTPDLPGEYFKKLQSIRDLTEGSRALQQVRGQAALEKYKAELDAVTGGGPLERSRALLNMVKSASGGGGGGGFNTALMNLMVRVMEANEGREARTAQQQFESSKDKRKTTLDLQQSMRQDLDKMKWADFRNRIHQSRAALMNPNAGIKDYEAIVTFIKTLDRDSAAMWGEVMGALETAGLVQRFINLPSRLLQGNTVPPEMRKAVLDSLTMYEIRNNQEMKAKVGEYNEIARQQGIDPRDVTGVVLRGKLIPDQNLMFEATHADGRKTGKSIKSSNYIDAMRELEKEGWTLSPRGVK